MFDLIEFNGLIFILINLFPSFLLLIKPSLFLIGSLLFFSELIPNKDFGVIIFTALELLLKLEIFKEEVLFSKLFSPL